jgi:hypothetical protein
VLKPVQNIVISAMLVEIMGKEKVVTLRDDSNLLIRTGYQIARERKIHPIDVIQALQIVVGSKEAEMYDGKHHDIENREGLARTLTEIVKYSLKLTTWRRRVSTLAHRLNDGWGHDEIIAEFEKIGIEAVKEVCRPKPEKVGRVKTILNPKQRVLRG